jgi:hypothetical protein
VNWFEASREIQNLGIGVQLGIKTITNAIKQLNKNYTQFAATCRRQKLRGNKSMFIYLFYNLT